MQKKSKINSSLFILLFFSLIFSACNNTERNNNGKQATSESQLEAQKELLRHVVLFNFNDAASDKILVEIEEKFAALPGHIPEIHSFEWGINNSPEGLNNGLTHCFLVTFLSEEDREKYLPHPAHKDFVDFIGPYVEGVTVVDYWAK